jgi:hypothetical protein
VSLQLHILSPLRLARIGEEEAALCEILLLLSGVHGAELMALLLCELLYVLLDDLLLALHERGHGPGLGWTQHPRLLHYTSRLLLLLLLAPVLLLYDRLAALLQCGPDKLTTILLPAGYL